MIICGGKYHKKLLKKIKSQKFLLFSEENVILALTINLKPANMFFSKRTDNTF